MIANRNLVITDVITLNRNQLPMFVYVTHGVPLILKEKPRDNKQLRRREIATRTWENEHLFDAESHYQYAASNVPELTPFQGFLARTIYNPVVPLSGKWRRVGDFDASDLLTAVQVGLDHDDDIIQQWFDASDVLELLDAAKSWDETLLAVEAICGGHEDTPKVAAYVKRVLPNA